MVAGSLDPLHFHSCHISPRYLALLPVEILAGMPVFLYLFAAFIPPHRCRVQPCDRDEPRPPLANETWTDFAIPEVEVVEGLFSSRGATEECAMFRVLNEQEGDCAPDNFDRNVTVACQGPNSIEHN